MHFPLNTHHVPFIFSNPISDRDEMRPIIKAALLITTVVLTVLGLYRFSHATNSIVIPTTEQIARMNAGELYCG